MLFLHSLRLWNLWDVFFFIPTCKHANSRSHKFKALLEKSRQLFFCFFSCYVQFFRFGFVTFPHASSRLHMEEEKHIELEMEPTPWAGSGYWLLAPAIAAYLAACFWKLYLIFWGGTLWFFLCFYASRFAALQLGPCVCQRFAFSTGFSAWLPWLLFACVSAGGVDYWGYVQTIFSI